MEQKLINLLREFTEVEDLADFGKMDSLMEKARNLLAQIETDSSIIEKLAIWCDNTSFMVQQRTIRELYDPKENELRSIVRIIDNALAGRGIVKYSDDERYADIESKFKHIRFDPNKLWNYLKETI